MTEVLERTKRHSKVHGIFKHPDPNDEMTLGDPECSHRYWIQKCSICRAIMASDSQVNLQPGESLMMAYTPLDRLVCTYRLALKLQKANIVQKSKLYWMEVIEPGILTLRCKGNVMPKGTNVASAFTSSELSRHIYRLLPPHALTSSVYEYVGKNAHDPNRLARLLLRKLKIHGMAE